MHTVDISFITSILFYVVSFAALGPYVFMGIVAYLGQLLTISNDWTDLVLINIIVRSIHQFLSLVYQWEWGFNSGLHPLSTGVRFLGWGWISCWLLLAVMTMFSSAAFSCYISSQIIFGLWQFLTIICMVFGTILILHSWTQCCVVSCFLWVLRRIYPYWSYL